jgi:hypothetical protein
MDIQIGIQIDSQVNGLLWSTFEAYPLDSSRGVSPLYYSSAHIGHDTTPQRTAQSCDTDPVTITS